MIALDTSVVVPFLNGRQPQVRTRYYRALDAGETIVLPVVALHELRFGAGGSRHPERAHAKIDNLLAGRITIEPFTPGDATIAGELRATLARRGTPISPYDVLIAAQALRLGARLATGNVGEFARVKGLVVKDWTAGG